MKFPDKISIGDKYGPAMKITDQAEAAAYFEACVEHCMRFDRTQEEAETIEKSNLGYFAGYYDHATRQQVERIFQCYHPVFGKAGTTPVSPEEALAAGKAMAERTS